MSKTGSASTLYRLIEAGRRARRALLEPLHERGLEPGDDAILLALADPSGAELAEIAALTGLTEEALEDKLRRLEDRGVLLRLAVGPEMVSGARLSQQGQAARQAVEAHWAALEEGIARDLGKKERRALRQSLKRIIASLDPTDQD